MRKYLLFEIFEAYKSFIRLINHSNPQAKCFYNDSVFDGEFIRIRAD